MTQFAYCVFKNDSEVVLKKRTKMFSASTGISIEPKWAATRKLPFLCSIWEGQGFLMGLQHHARPRALCVTAGTLLCLVGREGWTNSGLLPSPL